MSMLRILGRVLAAAMTVVMATAALGLVVTGFDSTGPSTVELFGVELEPGFEIPLGSADLSASLNTADGSAPQEMAAGSPLALASVGSAPQATGNPVPQAAGGPVPEAASSPVPQAAGSSEPSSESVGVSESTPVAVLGVLVEQARILNGNAYGHDRNGRRVTTTTAPAVNSTTSTTAAPVTTTTAPKLTSTTAAPVTSTTQAVTTTTKAATTTTVAVTTTTKAATTTSVAVTTTAAASVPANVDVVVRPGESIQAAVNANPAGTVFLLASGTHRRQQVSPKKGNVFIGQPGAILNGEGVTEFAFGGTSTHVVIKGLVVENYANPLGTGAIRTSGGAYDWVVENNEIRNNAGAGIYATQRWVVRGNNIHHNGQMGIFAVGENLLIENNEIAYNNTGNHNRTQAGGTKFMKTKNLVVRANYSHHNNGPGLWTDGSNIYTLYENNVVANNVGPGILHEVSYDAVIRNNTAEGNGFGYNSWVDGAGILVNSSSNVEVHGNIVRNNNDGIGGVHAREGESGQYGAYNLKNLYVHHNTIVMSVGHTGIVTNRSNEVYGSSFNNRFDYNTYTLGTNANYFRWQGGEQNWQSWRAAGQDPNGSATR